MQIQGTSSGKSWRSTSVFRRGLPYTEKLAGLKNNNIGLWDVIFSCERHGAMDHAIRNATPNDIPLFLNDHPAVRMVIANGTTAGRYLGKFRPEWPSRVSFISCPRRARPMPGPPLLKNYARGKLCWKLCMVHEDDPDHDPGNHSQPGTPGPELINGRQ